ncbi:MAG TPA: hypothetical protein VEJ47_17690 [Candidatus Eremiobacteraceae bacterium]|nr:hypothetical protein [Candidatus Eremiobacteraceae bacterium]
MSIPTNCRADASRVTNLIPPDVLAQHRNLEPPHIRLLAIDGEFQAKAARRRVP